MEQEVFNSKFHFSPKVVGTVSYAQVVAETLLNGVQGKRLLVQGQEPHEAVYVDHDHEIQEKEYQHAKENIIQLAQKYNSVAFEGYEKVKLWLYQYVEYQQSHS